MATSMSTYERRRQTNGDSGGDCANLIAISSTSPFSVVQAKVFQHTEQPWPAGNWKNIVFSHTLTEEGGNLLWDGTNDNPIIEVTMKVKGDYKQAFLPHQSGDPAAFGIKLGEEGKLELPIDQSSWEEAFQAGEDGMMQTAKTHQGSPSLWPPLQSEWRCSSTLQRTRTKSLRRDSAHRLNRCSNGFSGQANRLLFTTAQ